MIRKTLIVACVLAQAALYAQPKCSNQTVQGSYATLCHGFIDLQAVNPSAPAGSFVPYGCLGRFTVNADGMVTASVTYNVAGTILTPAVTDAKITVNEDCTGELQYNIKMGSGAAVAETHKVIVAENGESMSSVPLSKSPSICTTQRVGPNLVKPVPVVEETSEQAAKKK